MRKIKNAIYAALLISLPIMSMAQEKGIRFERGLSWQEVQAKAKAENKYIFVDCFATWCGPCKAMDKDIYLKDTVGNYFNDKFISIKLQMDSSKEDNEEVKSWYKDARRITQQYEITAFPTLLFFSSDGKMVHKGIGYKSITDFLTLGAKATDPQKQYYTLLEKYNQGKAESSSMPYLVETANDLNQKDIANTIANDYTNNYLSKLRTEQLYTQQNIRFITYCIANGTLGSNEKGFKLFYNHADKINKLMADSVYVQKIVDFIIAKEEIDPNLWRNNKAVSKNPEWDKMESVITKKYDKAYAVRTVKGAKMRWREWEIRVYESQKDWPAFTSAITALIEVNGEHMDNFDMNQKLWEIFQRSTQKDELNIAIKWQKMFLQKDSLNANALDTYANLLYKVGKSQEGLAAEKKAAELSPDDQEIQSNYKKMQKREPTWLIN